MRITYDSSVNAAYITIGEKKGDLETHEIGEGVLVDINSDGSLYGIELLNAKEQFAQTDDGFVVLTDIANGNEVRLRISQMEKTSSEVEPA